MNKKTCKTCKHGNDYGDSCKINELRKTVEKDYVCFKWEESAYRWKQFSGRRLDNGEQVEGSLIANKDGKCWIVGEMIEANEEYCTVEYWYPVNPVTVAQTEERKKMNNMRSCAGCVWLDARADGAGGGTCNCLKKPGLVVGEWGHWADPKYDGPAHPAAWNCWEAPRKEEF